MARVRPRRLVIDASVGRAAGDKAKGASYHCKVFLTTVFTIGHSAVMTDALLSEWQRNRSREAKAWLRKMYGAHRVIIPALSPDDVFRAHVEGAAPEKPIAAIMLKDCHLIEAALAADSRIASLDEEARRHFGRAATQVRPLRRICWVNPTIAEEQSIEWLRQGAPVDRHRCLGATAGR